MTTRPTLAFALSLCLAACAEVPQSHLIEMRSPGTMSFASAATSQGPMYVETIGTPFATGVPLDGMAFARDVAAAFLSPRLRFTAVRAEAPRPDFRLVWVFDPPDNLQLDTLCSGDARPAPARNAAIVKVAAAFCFEARLYAVARGSVKRPGDATDGPWRQLVHQISRELVN